MYTRLIYFITLFAILLVPKPVLAVSYDLNSSTNYHLRIDGAATNDKLSNYDVNSVDLNGNGKDDLLIMAVGTDYNSRNASGSLYILYDSLLDDYVTKGNTLDLNNASSYNVRIDGPAANSGILRFVPTDLNNDGLIDLVVSGDQMDFNSRTNSGSTYILYNSLFSGYSGTGNTIDLNTSTNYNLRIDGEVASDRLGTYLHLVDIDQNSKPDLLVAAWARNSSEGSVYLIKDSILDDYTTTGNTIDLATTSNFNVRWDGGSTISLSLGGSMRTGDFDNDGKNDVVIGSSYTDYNSRTDSGSSWIVFNTLLDDYTGTGNVVNISSSSSYNVRVDGSVAEYYLNASAPSGRFLAAGTDNLFLYESPNSVSGFVYMIGNSLLSTYAGTTGNTLNLSSTTSYNLKVSTAAEEWPFGIELVDYTNDSYKDLIIGAAYGSQNSRSNSGSTYLLSGATLNNYLSTTGNALALSSANDYVFRIDGANANDYSPYRYAGGDFNGDGVRDLVITSQDTDYNSRNNSGSVWITYNFPYSLSEVTTSQGTDSLQIQGTVTAINSITNISGVQYRLDSNSPTSGWSNCTATDGSFNSTTEAFTCNSGVVTQGTHTMYVRALDSNSVYTAQSRFYAKTFSNGTGSSSTSSGTRAQIVPSGGGVFGSTGDSNTGDQRVFTVAQADTLTFDAFLSAKIVSPVSFYPTTVLGKKGTNAILAGGSLLGVRSSGGTRWQVGNVQYICYKAYPPIGSDKEAAKIIPSLHKKSSIVALSYTKENLIPVGQPKKKYNPSRFALAVSSDGKMWKILPSSVVDTVNRTVAALDKPCGYYMIVGR